MSEYRGWEIRHDPLPLPGAPEWQAAPIDRLLWEWRLIRARSEEEAKVEIDYWKEHCNG